MAGSSDARGSSSGVDPSRVVRPLAEVSRLRDADQRLGRKASILAKMSAADVPVPDSWILEARRFDGFVSDVLPRKHELRALTKLAGTPEGEDLCARAFEEIVSAPLPEELVAGIQAWCASLDRSPSSGIVVRPSVVAAGDRATDASRYLHSERVEGSPRAVLAAIQRVWASAFSSLAVGRYAECGVRELSIALLLQPVVVYDRILWLTRSAGVRDGGVGSPWQLGVQLGGENEHVAEPIAFAPFALGRGGSIPETHRFLHDSLPPRGFEWMKRAADVAERSLGNDALIAFAYSNAKDPQLVVLHVDDCARWRTRDVEADSAWLEVLVGRGERTRRTPLSQSLLSRSVERATSAGLHALGASADEPRQLVWSSGGRTYLGLHALGASLHDLPALSETDLLSAIGTASPPLHARLARHGDAPKRIVREVTQGIALVSRQARLQREVGELERQLQRSARAFGEMDLTLLPTDGISTTLSSVDELLGQAVELWARVVASQLCAHVALKALLRRASGEATEATAAVVMSGAGGTYGASMVLALARVVDVFRSDDAGRASLAGEASTFTALADGPARGALGQFLSSYGDIASSPFDIERPRWSEDSTDLLAMIRAWLDVDGKSRTSVEMAQERVRARADAELARYEPELGWTERSALRFMVERARAFARARAGLDRLVCRVLALFRTVVKDADRRVLRIDASGREGAAFSCSFERLVASFRTGRPELHRIVAMHDFERELEASESPPPFSFMGSPPRISAPPLMGDALRGAGVSGGVVDGQVRLVKPPQKIPFERGAILVVPALDLAQLPRYFQASGVVCETGGLFSPVAEALRELGTPAVLSAEGALASLSEGERVRIDGERGSIHRMTESLTP